MREVPSIPAGLDPKLRNVLSAVRESLNAAITNINLNAENLAGMNQWIQPALDANLQTFNESLIQASLESATGADGAAGINARAVTLTTPNQSFAYNSLGLVPAPATSVMTATAFNTTGEIYYEFFINDVSTGTATTTNTYTYTPNASFDSMPDKLEVQIREGAIDGPIEARDMMTLFGLKEGSNGITVMLSNEAHTLPNSVANVVTYTGSGTNINVWQGATALTEDSSSPYANSTFRVTAAGTGITPGAVTGTGTTTLTYGNSSAMTTDPAKIIFTIIATLKDGTAITVTKQQSLSFSNAGGRGSRQFYAYGTAWTDAAALAAVVAVDPAGVVYGDTVTISNNSSFVMVKYWNGSAWVASGIILDGSLIVTNSITAAKINSNGLSIKDAYGNIILAAGSALDFSNVGGSTKPADNATNSNIYRQTAAPTGGAYTVNDLWVDTDSNPTTVSYWSGSAWVVSSTYTTNTNQLTDGSNLGGTSAWTGVSGTGKPVDNATKNTIYRQAAIPTGGTYTVGDLWFDTDSSPALLYNWSGSAWVVVANNVTNTNQVTDGAGLGTTSTWSGVSGTGKPANNATVGAYLGDSTGAGGNVTGKIGGVYIADLTVDTLHIKNNAVSYNYWSPSSTASSITYTTHGTSAYPTNIMITAKCGVLAAVSRVIYLNIDGVMMTSSIFNPGGYTLNLPLTNIFNYTCTTSGTITVSITDNGATTSAFSFNVLEIKK